MSKTTLRDVKVGDVIRFSEGTVWGDTLVVQVTISRVYLARPHMCVHGTSPSMSVENYDVMLSDMPAVIVGRGFAYGVCEYTG